MGIRVTETDDYGMTDRRSVEIEAKGGSVFFTRRQGETVISVLELDRAQFQAAAASELTTSVSA